MTSHGWPIPSVEVYDLELGVLAQILRRAGYLVLSKESVLNIEETLAAIVAAINGLPAATAAAVVAAMTPGATPADIAAAVVAAMPAPIVDFSGVLSAIADARAAASTSEGVTQAHLDTIDTEVQTVQSTLGPPPAP